MHILKRIGFYLGGFSIGLILLAFFFSGKRLAARIFPQERVLKNLRIKPYTITPEAAQSLTAMQLDSVTINRLLQLGEVDFSKSEQRKEPCGYFVIVGDDEAGNNLTMELENCEDVVKVVSVEK